MRSKGLRRARRTRPDDVSVSPRRGDAAIVTETLLTVRQLATRWGRSYAWVSARVKTGAIPHFRVNGVHFIRLREAEAWLETQRVSSPSQPAARRASSSDAELLRAMGITAANHPFL